jgi:hypothetical protein
MQIHAIVIRNRGAQGIRRPEMIEVDEQSHPTAKPKEMMPSGAVSHPSVARPRKCVMPSIRSAVARDTALWFTREIETIPLRIRELERRTDEGWNDDTTVSAGTSKPSIRKWRPAYAVLRRPWTDGTSWLTLTEKNVKSRHLPGG